MCRLPLLGLILAGLLLTGGSAPAQSQLYEVKPSRNDPNYRRRKPAQPQSDPNATPPGGIDTRISVELFGGDETAGFQSQRWVGAFEHAGVALQIRSQMPGDKLSIREKQHGKLREVFLVGRLETTGSLTFEGHVFKQNEATALSEWLSELKAYGAQGSPRGKALWGLSSDQFDALFRALASPVEQELADQPLEDALRGIGLSDRYPLRLSYAAKQIVAAAPRSKSRLQLRGFSQGTALALLLSQYGLGFRPERTPAGKIELVAKPADDSESLWPTGWEHLEGASSPVVIAPKLFQQTLVELKDQKLVDVLEAIGQKTNAPVLLDYAKIEGRGLDVGSVSVTVEKHRYAWATLLTRITSPSFLTTKICCDEAHKPFVWVTTLKNAGTLRRARAARPAKPQIEPEN
ncbi:MAG TPA: hypothetical protein VGP63_06875 [Planctomycetaceae bacterium]|nr:hypothetical protein [Planctomycetaceae bacterium]